MAFQFFDSAHKLERYLRPGEVHPHVLSERLQTAQSFNIGHRIQSLATHGAGRPDKAHPFVMAQCLRVNPDYSGRHADNEARFFSKFIVSRHKFS
jgi:hypothetical protein